MDEIMEAEKFNAQLEKILAGRPVGEVLDPELGLDLAFAARLAAADFSGESRQKQATKTKILARAGENRLRSLLRKPGVRALVLAGFALMLVAVPFFMRRERMDYSETPSEIAMTKSEPTLFDESKSASMNAAPSAPAAPRSSYYFGKKIAALRGISEGFDGSRGRSARAGFGGSKRYDQELQTAPLSIAGMPSLCLPAGTVA